MSLVFNMVGGGGGGIKLVSLAITTPPAKTTYTQGETFDPAGMVVTATYSNGATLKCTGYSYEPDTALADGTEKITVRYTEGGVTLTAEQSISVIHRLTGIEITTPPTKTTYEYKDSFQAAGMVVTATYSDGATAAVTGYSASPTTFTTVGSQSVTISYTERGVTKTAVTAVTVNKKVISAIPSQSGTLTYNGSTRYPSWTNYDSEELSVSGTTSAVNAGSYTAVFTPRANYCWSDGTTTAKNVTWTIGKASGSLSISPTTMTLDSSTTSASITVTRAGDGKISAVSGAPGIATASVSGNTVTVTGVSNGNATITISVAAGTNHTAPSSKTCTVTVDFLKANFADNTWDQIIEACHSGTVPDTWVVGNSKTMTIDGTSYQFDIVGKGHDTYTEGGTAPITLGLHDCYGTAYPMNSSQTNSTGWDGSKMRTETLAAILAKMPENIRNGIRAVNKLTATSGSSSTIKTASDKLFVFSEMEVYGSTTYSYAGEGKQYDYYKAGNSKVKKLDSSAARWWLRSPLAYGSSTFCAVDTDGSAYNDYAHNSYGVCFGFCF